MGNPNVISGSRDYSIISESPKYIFHFHIDFLRCHREIAASINDFRHSEIMVKYNIGLKTLLQQGISEPIFYGDLVYKFKRIVGKPNFSDQFKKIVKRYIRVGYNLDIMRQSACLVLNPITVYSYGFLFNYTTVGQASDSMTALT